ncbi:MAG: hypothetical protein GEU79_07955 [Acidimicrobiia bacterium]|nr:hypothetical protein [Acidimicrobiia bacterium]
MQEREHMTAAREALYTRLREVLGYSEAETLIEIMPQTSDITRTDIDDLSANIEIVKLRVGHLEDRMDRLEDRMDRLEDRMDRLETLMERFDDRLHDFHGELRQQTRTFVLASTSSAAIVAMVSFAAASLI